jgi:hypothetical protein
LVVRFLDELVEKMVEEWERVFESVLLIQQDRRKEDR